MKCKLVFSPGKRLNQGDATKISTTLWMHLSNKTYKNLSLFHAYCVLKYVHFTIYNIWDDMIYLIYDISLNKQIFVSSSFDNASFTGEMPSKVKITIVASYVIQDDEQSLPYHWCFYFLTRSLMTLQEILTTASKKPKKENPTNSPKVPPSSATLKSRYILVTGVSNVHDKTHQWWEGIDELLHLVPGIVWHLGLDGLDLPRLVGDGPQGEQKMIWFHSRWLLHVGIAVLPVVGLLFDILEML